MPKTTRKPLSIRDKKTLRGWARAFRKAKRYQQDKTMETSLYVQMSDIQAKQIAQDLARIAKT